jgi:type IV pilus assembly protein PilP
MRFQHQTIVILGAVSMWLSGCSIGYEEDLQQWMAQQRQSMKPQVAPISEPIRFMPQDYQASRQLDPFNVQKMNGGAFGQSDAVRQQTDSALIAPEKMRRKEALEAYPLDTMSFVGSLQKKSKRVALLKVDKMLYQVMLGAYIGQNYGKITKITDSELTLREIVQDAAGEWIERSTVLQLQEEKK